MTRFEMIRSLSECDDDQALKGLFDTCRRLGYADSWSDDGLEFAKMHYAEGVSRRGGNFIIALIKAREIARELKK